MIGRIPVSSEGTGEGVGVLADHAVERDGKYYYGGDFDELTHDGNFCVDGLVSPKRELKAGSLEAKAVFQPF